MAIEEINFTAENVNFVMYENGKHYYFEFSKNELAKIYYKRYPAGSDMDHHKVFDQYKNRIFQMANSLIQTNDSGASSFSLTSRDYFKEM